MITGVHAILYTKDAGKTRAFFRDVLGLRSVDAGRGWLIFALPPAELAAHPDNEGGRQELYLICSNLKKAMGELAKKGVQFTRPVADRGWGLLTAFKLPGAGEMWLYEPRHPMAIQAPRRKRTTRRSSAPAKRRR